LYLGIQNIKYNEIASCILEKMEWPLNGEPNYYENILELIEKRIKQNEPRFGTLWNLLTFILENVHDHGTGQCKVTIGNSNRKIVIVVFEKFGGFNLKNLPKGKGGWGFRAIKRSEWKVSHSKDGKSTFIISP
jgi:hypothetical protein